MIRVDFLIIDEFTMYILIVLVSLLQEKEFPHIKTFIVSFQLKEIQRHSSINLQESPLMNNVPGMSSQVTPSLLASPSPTLSGPTLTPSKLKKQNSRPRLLKACNSLTVGMGAFWRKDAPPSRSCSDDRSDMSDINVSSKVMD